jgi:iron complex transport system substrate-binding protein
MRYLSSKSGLLIAFILVCVLVSACGNSAPAATEKPAQPPAESTAPAETEASEPATKMYKDALGREVEIPANPQRIVTTQYLPEMIAIGVKPVGAVSHLLSGFISIKDQIGGIEDIGPANEMNLEKALELQPDLIIATEWNEAQLEQLSKIAPTVVVKWEGNDAFKHFKDVADVLGKSDKAEQWIKDFNQKAEEARAELAPYVKEGETFGVVVIGGYEKGQLRVYGTGNVGYTLFDTLQFPMTDVVKTEWDKGGHELGINLSLEKLNEFASADRLFVVKFDNDPDFLKKVEESSLWSMLPAVKNKKVYTVDNELWFSYDVMSFKAQLDDAVQLLSK